MLMAPPWWFLGEIKEELLPLQLLRLRTEESKLNVVGAEWWWWWEIVSWGTS